MGFGMHAPSCVLPRAAPADGRIDGGDSDGRLAASPPPRDDERSGEERENDDEEVLGEEPSRGERNNSMAINKNMCDEVRELERALVTDDLQHFRAAAGCAA